MCVCVCVIHSFVSEMEEVPLVGMCGLGQGLRQNLEGLLFDAAIAHCQCFEGRGPAWLRQVFDYLNVITTTTNQPNEWNEQTLCKHHKCCFFFFQKIIIIIK